MAKLLRITSFSFILWLWHMYAPVIFHPVQAEQEPTPTPAPAATTTPFATRP